MVPVATRLAGGECPLMEELSSELTMLVERVQVYIHVVAKRAQYINYVI